LSDEECHHERQGDGDNAHRREQGRDPEHHAHDAHDRQHRGEQLAETLLDRGGEVVDVVGDPAQHVAVRMAVEVAQGQSAELRLDVASQAGHHALGEPGHREALEVAEGRAKRYTSAARPSTRPRSSMLTPTPGVRFHPEIIEAIWEWPSLRSMRDRLGLRGAGLQVLAHEPSKEHVGRVAEDLGARHHEGDRRDARARTRAPA
jgi:hypothetical protein